MVRIDDAFWQFDTAKPGRTPKPDLAFAASKSDATLKFTHPSNADLNTHLRKWAGRAAPREAWPNEDSLAEHCPLRFAPLGVLNRARFAGG